MGAGLPLDLLLFGMIAAFLVLRLRGILGRRTGFERPQAGVRPGAPPAPSNVVDIGKPAAPSRKLPEAGTPTAQALARMGETDRSFDPARFLSGAEAAFRMIVTAFAQGDRTALRPLLTDDTYRGFEGAIAAREAAGETQRSEIRSIEQAAIEEAGLTGTHAAITVRIVSDQVAETLNAAGLPVAGTDAVTEITDLWTFERDLSDPNPAWRLSATRSG